MLFKTPDHTASTQVVLNTAAQDQRRSARTVILRTAGFEVVEAASASQAISTVVHAEVALAVLDGDLPDCDPATLAETLQGMRPAMAVVVVSTGSDGDRLLPHANTPVDDEDDAHLMNVIATTLRDDHSLDPDFDPGCDPEVVTDQFGHIEETSDVGARLLNGSARGLFQRNLLTFFDGNRDLWHDAVRRATAGQRVQLTGRLRPKERRPFDVSVRIISRLADTGVTLEWAFAVL